MPFETLSTSSYAFIVILPDVSIRSSESPNCFINLHVHRLSLDPPSIRICLTLCLWIRALMCKGLLWSSSVGASL